MNYKKRAGIYLLRKKEKTISVFLLFLVVSTFLFSCFSLLNASEHLGEDIRKSLGAAFYLRASTGITTNANGEVTVSENKAHITDDDIQSVLACGDISYYNPIAYGYAKGDGVTFIPGDQDDEESNMGQVAALHYSALADDFTSETLYLKEGEHITKEDTNAVLISSTLALVNNLSVGDTVVLQSARLGIADGDYIDEMSEDNSILQATIVGIYDILIPDATVTATAGMQENKIYASLDVLEKLNEIEPSVYNGEVDFYVTDPKDLDEIISKVQNIQTIDWNIHFVRANDFQYSKVSDSLQSLSDLVCVLLLCVSVVSTIILTLILTLRTRGRIQEAGVLLATGISKKEIIKQFLLEVFVAAVIALLLSFFAAHEVTQVLKRYLFADFELNLINEDTFQAGTSGAIEFADYLKLGIGKTVLIYICQAIVITVSVILSSITVLRMKPREILTMMS